MKQGLALSVVGLSIGWLAGLSVSPVIGIVVTSIMGFVGAGLAVLQEIQRTRSVKTTAPEPLTTRPSSSTILVALLSCTTAVGATFGVWARTHEWLAPTEMQNLHRWTQLGIKEAVVRDRLFESRFKVNDETHARQPVLFSYVASDACMELGSLEGDDLKSAAKAATDERISTLAAEFDSPTLARVLRIICGQK